MDWLFPAERLFSTPGPSIALMVGVVLGVAFGLLPGINGKKGIILSIPFLAALDPLTAVVYLVAMHAVVHTCGSLPAVLVGVPTSASEAAVVLDGYPLVKQGRAGEAIAATIGASAVGGLIGALALIAFIPIGLLLVPHIGSAEVMALTMLGLLAVSALSGKSLVRGLIVAAFGLLIATVGFDNLTGAQRYTFHQMTLAPGLNIASLLAGLFVIPEMISLGSRPEAERGPIRGMRILDIVKGMAIAIRRFGIVFRASIIGIIVGFIPGIGSSVSVWMAYGHAVQTEPHTPPFGQGNVAGLLAAEAANNSKEGGSFAPTLMFAVPGSSGMAIMMLAFSFIGVDVGPRLVAQDPGFISMVGWVILAANLLAIPACLAFVPTFSFIATLKQRAIMPIALVLSAVAAIVVLPHPASIIQMAVFGLVGVAFKHSGWPRPPLILGFVMGPILESTLSRTMAVYGWEALLRPGVAILLSVGIGIVVWSGFRSRHRRQMPAEASEEITPAPVLAVLVMALFAWAAVTAQDFAAASARMFPVGASILGMACCVIVLIQDGRRFTFADSQWRRFDPGTIVPMLGFFVLAPVTGLPLATLLYVLVSLIWAARVKNWIAVVIAIATAWAAFFLGHDLIGPLRPFDKIWLWLTSFL
ncbi:MAG: tripartite tricarboxylate transporter permease [Cucumibacter sp.]